MSKKLILVGNIGRSLPAATVTINDTELRVIAYRGHRVVTLAQVDEVHQRPSGTARRSFNEHRARLIEGEDFFEVTANEKRTQSLRNVFPARTPKGILLTEQGYLMVVKPFKDELAWQMQRQLVKGYFRHQQPAEQPPAVPYVVGRGDSLNQAEQDTLRGMIYTAREQLPAAQQGEFTTQAWSKLKSHFHYKPGQNYRHIPRCQFGEAMALIERHIAEFEPSKKMPVTISYSPSSAEAVFISTTQALADAVPVLAKLLGRKPANDPPPASRRVK